MRARVIQNAFNAGEFSPEMLGRSDLDTYRSAAQTLENWLIRPQGGILKRSGARFLRPIEDQSVVGRVVPFVFSTTQAYILEFCDQKIRFIMDEGSVLRTATNISATTKADPCQVTTAAPHGASTGEMVYLASIGGMTELNNRHYTITVVDATHFTLDDEDSTGYTTYTAGGTAARVYEITTTYTEAELPYLRFAQSADKLYIVHEDHAPAVLTRTAHTSWTLADHDFIDGPYLELRTTTPGSAKLAHSITLDPNSHSDPVSLSAGGAGFFSGARDVGRMLRYHHPSASEVGGMDILTVTNATTATATVKSGYDPLLVPPDLVSDADPNTTTEWYLGAYYTDNYPRAVAFFEGRLAFAGTPGEPERLDASVTGGWDDFRPTDRADNTVNDDDGISYQLGGANDVQVIRWLATIRNLVIGTTGGIWPVQASSSNEAVTPTNINMPRASAYGCAAVQPVTAFDTVVYVSRTAKKVLAAGYSFDSDSYATQDLTIMAEHITGSGINFMEYQQEPHSVIWCLRSDGQLAGMTYERGQKVFGWHRHIIGGCFGAGEAVVESIAVIPSPNEDHDQLWMIVKRTVNSSTVRYIEFLEQDFESDDAIEDAFFVDSGLTYDGAAVSTITGLNHLEGETVQVLADGAVHPDRTVSGGSITLDDSYSVVHVGYGYNANCESLPLVLPDTSGATFGKLVRPDTAYLRLHRTLGLEYGTDEGNLIRLPFRSTSDPMDAPPPLFTGIKQIPLSHGHDQEGVIYLRQPDPLPAMVLCAGAAYGVSDR